MCHNVCIKAVWQVHAGVREQLGVVRQQLVPHLCWSGAANGRAARGRRWRQTLLQRPAQLQRRRLAGGARTCRMCVMWCFCSTSSAASVYALLTNRFSSICVAREEQL